MTSNEIAIRHDGPDSWLDVAGPVAKFADYICRTDFVPKAMRGNPAAVTATILTGRELDMGPLTALRSLDVIEGNVQMKTKAILARIFKAGHKVIWLEATDKACEVRIERGDGLTTAQIRWTMADAQRAELASKAVWRRYPRAMLRSRALSECAELACPDVILGMEAGDDGPAPEATGYAPTTVQIAQEPPQEPITAELVEVVAPEIPEATEPLCTGAQLRKIGALIGEWESENDRKLDRTERRRLIGFYAGVEDPDSLESAKELTFAQASAAIEALQDELAPAIEVETVDEPTQGELA